MRLNAYLYFDGTCRDAFQFYAAATGGTPGAMMRYGEAPDGTGGADMADKILHASLDVGGTTLMGSDMAGAPACQGFAVTLAPETAAEAERVFAALAEGGTVTVPIGPTFWTERFGMLTDRFGVPWLVNMDGPPPPAA